MATVGPTVADAEANAYTSGVIPTPDAHARANVTQAATVNVAAGGNHGTALTGRHGVDLLAVNDPAVAVTRHATSDADGVHDKNISRNGVALVTGTVTVPDGVLVAAGTRGPITRLVTPSGLTTQTALVVGAPDTITWNGDAAVLAGNVSVAVDAAGNLTASTPGLATFANNLLTVNDLDAGPGQVLFTNAAAVVGSDTRNYGKDDNNGDDEIAIPNAYQVLGTTGLVTFEQTATSVDIRSAKGGISLGNIGTYAAAGVGVEPKVVIDLTTNTLEFDVKYNFGPTAVTVADTDASLTGPGITLRGLIDNPIGTTTLSSAGSVVSANFAQRLGTIRTNRLELTSTGGDVGGPAASTTTRIPIQLVESPLRPAFAAVSAGRDVNVGLQGINRNPSVTTGFTTTTDPIPSYFLAGRSADLRLLGGLDQRTSGSPLPYGIQVFETGRVTNPQLYPPPSYPDGAGRTTPVTNHFRVSTSTGSPTPIGLAGFGDGLIDTTYALGLVQAGGSINLYKADSVTARVNIISDVDVRDASATAGNVSASTNGFVRLEEISGDLRVGRVESTDDDVTLTANGGSILDVPDAGGTTGDAAADAVGVNLTLSAQGTIGATANPFDVDSSTVRTGRVDADAQRDVTLYEVGGTVATNPGTLYVGTITSATGNVSLRSATGSIVESAADATGVAAVRGNVVTLRADDPTGYSGIGATAGAGARPLYVDSSYSAAGGLYAYAGGDVAVTETRDELYVLGVDQVGPGAGPSVTLATVDDASSRNDVIVVGRVVDFTLSVTAGDDFTQAADAPIVSFGTVTVQVDPRAGDADRGTGATLTLLGTVTAESLSLAGGDDPDVFNVRPQLASALPALTVNGNAPHHGANRGDRLNVLGTPGTVTDHVTDVPTGTGYETVTGGFVTVYYTEIERAGGGPAPTVLAVYANSSAWTAGFRDYVDGGFADPSALGHRIPTGAGQTRTLPWVNLDQLKVRFSGDVGASLTAADVAVTAAPGWVAVGRSPDSTALRMPALLALVYDRATSTATLQFAGPIPAAVLDLTITAAGVTDPGGVALDGEWSNNATAASSGDGTPGGNFGFRLFVLPGDAVDETGGTGQVSRSVDTTDSQQVRGAQHGLLAGTVAIGFDPRSDFDGNGTVDATDSQTVRDQQNAILYPVGVAAGPVQTGPVAGTPVVTAAATPLGTPAAGGLTTDVKAAGLKQFHLACGIR